MLADFGYVRIASVCPEVFVGDPTKNFESISSCIKEIDADILLFPELCLTGYTCGDLFGQRLLIEEAKNKLQFLAYQTNDKFVVVGLPFDVDGTLYNCAAVLNKGKILGIVPKSYLPNYKEFYEKRWFKSGKNISTEVEISGNLIPFDTDLLFQFNDVVVGIEICEDLWMTIPPSSYQALSGANILLNLSASNEIVGKADYRRELVSNQSGRCIAAYAYSSAGPTESTTDLVFGGHCLIAENGHILSESSAIGNSLSKNYCKNYCVITDVDVQKLNYERQKSSFGDNEDIKSYKIVPFVLNNKDYQGYHLQREIDGSPFVPSNPETLDSRCDEIFSIQRASLAKRISRLSDKSKLHIGVSGGLDSTLALLVAVSACDRSHWDRSRICGITMPGFGTTDKTYDNAILLMKLLGITLKEIDIREACVQMFKDIGHEPFGIDFTNLSDLEEKLANLPEGSEDVVFENVQARIRTTILMSHGFVLGTGDLSELALGWCTYNGDHMSMYNVNCSIPKTLVKFLVNYVADHCDDDMFSILDSKGHHKVIKNLLKDIVGTIISPELLPKGKDGEIAQSTESKVGPYELNDFFLSNFIRSGFSPKKIWWLATQAKFSKEYSSLEIRSTLLDFYRRFFTNQFKRSCVPDGPKVGSISLSPRGDWRMPSDAEVNLWTSQVLESELL